MAKIIAVTTADTELKYNSDMYIRNENMYNIFTSN